MKSNTSCGHSLGTVVARNCLSLADKVFAEQREQHRLHNQPDLEVREKTLRFQLQDEHELAEKVRLLPPPEELRTVRRKKFFYWLAAALLFFAECALLKITLDPFALGWKAYPFIVGIPLGAAYCIDLALRKIPSFKLLVSLCLLAGAVVIVCSVLLGVIRGQVFSLSISQVAPVVIEGATSTVGEGQADNSVASTVLMLKLVMALLGLTMPIALGLLAHEAQALNYRDGLEMHTRLQGIRREVETNAHTIVSLRSEPELCERRNRIDFLLEILDGQATEILKLLPAVLLLSLLLGGTALAAECRNSVVLLDLTRSTAVKDHMGATEFERNVQGVAEVLRRLGPGCRVTVMGITDDSFGRPLVLLSGRVADDPGPFRKRLEHAHKQLAEVWKQRAQQLKPSFRKSDVLGALALAARYCEEQGPAGCELVIFSDMRHFAGQFDLERPNSLDSARLLGKIELKIGIPKLTDAGVSIFGVHPVGKTPIYWDSLRQFWEHYFEKTGAKLRTFSLARELSAPAR